MNHMVLHLNVLIGYIRAPTAVRQGGGRIFSMMLKRSSLCIIRNELDLRWRLSCEPGRKSGPMRPTCFGKSFVGAHFTNDVNLYVMVLCTARRKC